MTGSTIVGDAPTSFSYISDMWQIENYTGGFKIQAIGNWLEVFVEKGTQTSNFNSFYFFGKRTQIAHDCFVSGVGGGVTMPYCSLQLSFGKWLWSGDPGDDSVP